MTDQITEQDFGALIEEMFPIKQGPGGPDSSVEDGRWLLVSKLVEMFNADGMWVDDLLNGLKEVEAPTTSEVEPLGVYRLTAEHYRFHSKWDGLSHSVRIKLPDELRDDEVGLKIAESGTGEPSKRWYGDILRKDHSVLSRDELLKAWEKKFKETAPAVEYVELTTGVRRQIREKKKETDPPDAEKPLVLGRFSPLSVFVAYDARKEPQFYALESGNFWGEYGKLHIARSMKEMIREPNDFAPTWFSEATHVYHGRLEMQGAHPRESEVWVSVTKDVAHHFRAHVLFEPLEAPRSAPGKKLQALFRFEALLNQMRAIGRQAVIAQAGHPIYRSDGLNNTFRKFIAETARWSPLLKWKSKPLADPRFPRQPSPASSDSEPQDE